LQVFLAGVGTFIVEGLQKGWETAWKNLTSTVGQLVTDLINLVKGLFGISSPSTIFKDFGINIIQGLIDGIESLLGSLAGTVGKIVDTLVGWFSGGDKEEEGLTVDSLVPTEADLNARIAALQSKVQAFATGVQTLWNNSTNMIRLAWTVLVTGLVRRGRFYGRPYRQQLCSI